MFVDDKSFLFGCRCMNWFYVLLVLYVLLISLWKNFLLFKRAQSYFPPIHRNSHFYIISSNSQAESETFSTEARKKGEWEKLAHLESYDFCSSYSLYRNFLTDKVKKGVLFKTFEDEFFPLSSYAYYTPTLYCNPSLNSFSFLSKLEHIYPSKAPSIPGDPTYRIHSIVHPPNVNSTYHDVGVLLFRNYNNIYHVLESLNSLLRYAMNVSYYPPVVSISLFSI